MVPVLVYAALSTAIVSSLGMLLVPAIAEEMDVRVSTAQWMLTVNLLVGAVATPVMGRSSDGARQKRLLVVSLLVVLVGCVVAATAPNFEVFLVGRALQGLTYGIVPVTIATARRLVAPERVVGAISSLSITVATGIGVGYPLTGMIAGTFNFRAAFWFAAVFVVSAVVVVVKSMPADTGPGTRRRSFDLPGAALLGLGLGTLLLGISEGPHWGWTSTRLIGVLLLAMVALGAWVAVELRTAFPLVNLLVLARVDVVVANGTAIGLGGAMYIGLSVGSLVAQAPHSTGYGMDLPVFWAGFVMFPLSVGSLAANRVVRRISRHVDLAALLLIGAGLIAVASAILWLAHSELWQMVCGMFLFGVGMGASYAAMPVLIARNVAAAELGSSVSFNQVLRTVGSSVGTAVSAAVIAAHLGPDGSPTDAGISSTFGVGALVCLVVFVVLAVRSVNLRRRRAG